MLSRPLQIRPYNSSYVVHDSPDPAPAAPGVAGGGGGGGMLSMFQRSVNKERAMNAFRAATFAQNAPAPAPGQSAYGAGPAGDRAAAAARTSYVAGKMAEANAEDFGTGEDAFARADEARAESGRKTRTVESEAGVRDAQAGLLGAESRHADAYTKTVLPTIAAGNAAGADATRAGAEATRGANGRENYLLQPRSQLLRAQARGADAAAGAAEAEAPYIPMVRQAEADRTRSLIAPQAALTQSQAALNNAQATAVARPPVPAPPDPGGALDLLLKRKKAAREEGERKYNEQTGILGTRLFRDAFVRADGKGVNKSADQLTQEAFDAQMPGGATAGATGAAGAPESQGAGVPAEGTRSVHKNGRPVVVRGGKWVFAD